MVSEDDDDDDDTVVMGISIPIRYSTVSSASLFLADFWLI